MLDYKPRYDEQTKSKATAEAFAAGAFIGIIILMMIVCFLNELNLI